MDLNVFSETFNQWNINPDFDEELLEVISSIAQW